MRVTVTDTGGLSDDASYTVSVIVPPDYGTICLVSDEHAGYNGTGFWTKWFLQHPNGDQGVPCSQGYVPDRSWDTDPQNANIGLGAHNSLGVSSPLNSLQHGSVVEVQMDIMLNTEYDYQEGGEGGYGLRNCGGGHLVNLTTHGRGLTCRENPCPGNCCPGDCIENVDATQRFELDQVRNKGFRIVSWHPGLGPSNQTDDATVAGLGWTHGEWLRFSWKVELLSNGGLNNQVRHTVTYISVNGVALPQPNFTVVKMLTFTQAVQWRKVHFLSFGNYDLCSGRRQEDTGGCTGPYLGKLNVRNIYIRDIQ